MDSAAITAHARALGFNLVGITPAQPSPHLNAYLRWIEAGFSGTMGYLSRPDRLARRRDLTVILPEVRSLIVVGFDYHALNIPKAILLDPSRGRIAAYAWGVDYHDVLTPRLESLAAWVADQIAPHHYKIYVDTGAILERSHAQQAGLGFIGKNTMLIHPRRGSYFFLGMILTDAPMDRYDAPHRETLCGTCNRCHTACPTDAFSKPYVLDARRCISYLTIEHKGEIDPALRPQMGNWIMGCDVCQDVCPFNRFAQPTNEPFFQPPSVERVAPLLLDVLALDARAFDRQYGKTPIARLGRDRFLRNACVAAGNWGDESAVPLLRGLLHDPNPLLPPHAQWALESIAQKRASVR